MGDSVLKWKVNTHNFVYLVALLFLIFNVPQTVRAQIFAKHDGLTATYYEKVHCKGFVRFDVEADEPYFFYETRRLYGLLGAVQAGLQFECPSAQSVRFFGKYKGHDLDKIDGDLKTGELGNGQLAFFKHIFALKKPSASKSNQYLMRGLVVDEGDFYFPLPLNDRKFFFEPQGLITHSFIGDFNQCKQKSRISNDVPSLNLYFSRATESI